MNIIYLRKGIDKHNKGEAKIHAKKDVKIQHPCMIKSSQQSDIEQIHLNIRFQMFSPIL